MTGRWLLAVDLDRTLIHSRSSLRADPPPAGASLVVVEQLDGVPWSVMTSAAAHGWERLAREQTVVPATTRTREQYRRLRLPGPPPRFAVVANGGHLLIDGVGDQGWQIRTRERIARRSVPLAEVVRYLAALAEVFGAAPRVADDLFLYLVLDAPASAEVVQDLVGWCGERGWEVSAQGRKVYLLPGGLDKWDAVREVAERVSAAGVLAAGDSVLDRRMLASARRGIRAAGGELAARGWLSPRVEHARCPGAVGGEEIVAWLLAASRWTPEQQAGSGNGRSAPSLDKASATGVVGGRPDSRDSMDGEVRSWLSP